MSIYLYVKTHNVTGLKYLGKTKQDPLKYKGSGKRWLAHINKHGNDITTEIIGVFNTNEDMSTVSKRLSEEWDIVNSHEWANLKPETGDGGAYYWEGMEEHLKIVSAKGRAKISTMTLTAWNKGKKLGPNGSCWWNNGKENTKSNKPPGPEWVRGRLFKKRPNKSVPIMFDGVLYRSIKEAVALSGATKYSILKYGISDSKQHLPFQQQLPKHEFLDCD